MDKLRFKGYAATAALLYVLAGCTQDEPVPDNAAVRPLGITSLSAPTAKANTRAATGLPEDGKVGFYLKENASAHYAATYNSAGSYQGTPQKMWSPDATIWLNNTEAELAIYYPYDATQSTTTGLLNLTAGLSADAAGKERDIWCAAFKASSLTTDIGVILKHLYSRLTVTFVKHSDPDKEYTADAKLTNVKLEGGGVYTQGTYSPLEKRYGYTAGTEEVSVPISGDIRIKKESEGTPVQVDLLLIPYALLTSDLTLTATVDGKPMSVDIPQGKLANTLAAGKQYTLTITLMPTGLELSLLKTTDWDDSLAGITGDATFLPPSYIDIGCSFYLALGNLTAVKDATGTYKYAFADDQGYYSSDGTGGDYFCWNVLDPTSTTTSGSEDPWKDENDPCQKVGVEWHTPSYAQLNEIVQKAQCQGTYQSGNNTINGYYFGVASAPNDVHLQDDYLFLPRAGYMSGSGYNGAGSFASYWSCTWNDASQYAYALRIQNSGTIDITKKTKSSYGFPIRCVRAK